ncbi:MAG TPA: translational machinery protein [Reyranella sp.]|nr:translational machinery protein [Reyranella sp.]
MPHSQSSPSPAGHSHAIVWMDSREAHVFRFSPSDVEEQRVRAHNPFRKVHHRAGTVGDGHMTLDRHYLDQIVQALAGVHEWLLTGPGTAKREMADHIVRHAPALAQTLCGVQTSNHPTDASLVDQARRSFRRIDRMRPHGNTGEVRQ